ncbi:MAG: hypothetical protein FD147_2300 [Chloroflexi bacterium]|nr:MAG: hypothetical protein FD147_2300 [Chloroflexota bacterium]MBA4376456.1 MBL fold metallo-hydrolase [Anaerolinea sp.]
MTLKLEIFIVGQLENNACILYDEVATKALIIDPSFESQPLLDFIDQNNLTVESILITHGHFDHFAGVSHICASLPNKPTIGLHRADLDLWRAGGGSKEFQILIDLPDEPDIYLEEQQRISLGTSHIEVRTAPGHSSGSVIFYIPDLNTALCGDVIFYHGVGRTDLPGGSYSTLMSSIKKQIFTLPPDTRLIPGHGPETTVKEEMDHNPYLEFSSL